MTSELNISDFKYRLNYHTKIGDPQIKGTPFAIFTVFGQSGKKFYGDFNNFHYHILFKGLLNPKTIRKQD